MFGLHSMCVGADAHFFNGHKDVGETPMIRCQKCDHR